MLPVWPFLTFKAQVRWPSHKTVAPPQASCPCLPASACFSGALCQFGSGLSSYTGAAGIQSVTDVWVSATLRSRRPFPAVTEGTSPGPLSNNGTPIPSLTVFHPLSSTKQASCSMLAPCSDFLYHMKCLLNAGWKLRSNLSPRSCRERARRDLLIHSAPARGFAWFQMITLLSRIGSYGFSWETVLFSHSYSQD